MWLIFCWSCSSGRQSDEYRLLIKAIGTWWGCTDSLSGTRWSAGLCWTEWTGNKEGIPRPTPPIHSYFTLSLQRAVETQLGLVYLPTAAVAEFYFPRFQLRSFTPHFHCEFVLVSLIPVRRNLLWVKLYVFFHNRVFEIQYFLVKIRKSFNLISLLFFKFKLFKWLAFLNYHINRLIIYKLNCFIFIRFLI
jgi:hypothetical protein